MDVCDGVGECTCWVLILGHCCALMLELLFGHVSMPAECSAVLTVVLAYECVCMGCGAYVL